MAADIIRKSLNGEFEAVITMQILFEFYSVITNPRRVIRPVNRERVARVCNALWNSTEIQKISPSARTPIRALELAIREKLNDPQIFDCVLAATCQENGVGRIYTENVKDFQAFEFLKVVNPFSTST